MMSVEVRFERQWYRYLTRAIDPRILPAWVVAAIYRRRWRIEEAFFIVKRVLNLSYLWTGSENGILLQVWSTGLFFAVLVNRGDALQLRYLILDFNGTLACDGALLEGVRPRLTTLAGHLDVHVLTGDTFGQARMALTGAPCRLTVLPAENQAEGKLRYIEQLGAHEAVCIGNGRNDRLALKAALGIAVIQTEGAAVEAVLAADIVLPSILPALDLLTHPLRLIATLRA